MNRMEKGEHFFQNNFISVIEQTVYGHVPKDRRSWLDFGIEFSEFENWQLWAGKKIDLVPYNVCKKLHCKDLYFESSICVLGVGAKVLLAEGLQGCPL